VRSDQAVIDAYLGGAAENPPAADSND